MKSKNIYFYSLISSQSRRFFSLVALVSVLILFPFVTHGAEVTLAWDANTEPDLAGYNIYYGTASGDYSDSIDVGDVTEYPVTGLDDGGTYYFAATAYDEDDNESAYSEELIHTFSYSKPIVDNLDYCRDFGPCSAGEGDCDSDSECEAGLTCVQVTGTDTCQSDVVTLPVGHNDYCRDFGPCGAGEGDCDNDSECAAGLTCVQVTGTDTCQASSPDLNSNPTTPSVPAGPSTGHIQTSYNFSTAASDPDGDALQYRFDWGDGVISIWGSASQTDSWSSPGNYCVKAQAEDSNGALSAWSECKSITITENTYNITASAGANGSITPSGNVTVNQGATSTFLISADANYHVQNVLVDGTSKGATAG